MGMTAPRPRRARWALLVLAVPAVAWAVPRLEGPLRMPEPPAGAGASAPVRQPPVAAHCQRPARRPVPFAPGERLVFEADVLGLDIAEVRTEVGAPVLVDGQGMWPLSAQVASDWTIRLVAAFDGDMRSWVDPATLAPARTAWRMSARTPEFDFFGESGVVFSAPGRVDVQNHWVHHERGGEPVEERKALAYKSQPGLQDWLSVVYAARTLELAVGMVVCPALHFVDNPGSLRAEVVAREEVDVDYDERWAYKIAIRDPRPREENDLAIYAWISDDRDRLPLRLSLTRGRVAFDLELDDVEHVPHVPHSVPRP